MTTGIKPTQAEIDFIISAMGSEYSEGNRPTQVEIDFFLMALGLTEVKRIVTDKARGVVLY